MGKLWWLASMMMMWAPGRAAAAMASPPVRYDGTILVEVDVAQAGGMAQVQALGGRFLAEFEHEGPQLVLLDFDEQSRWALSSIGYRVINADVQASIDHERARLAAGDPNADFYDEFQNSAAIFSRLEELQAAAPERVSLHVLGQSIEKREIRGIEVRGKGREKPAILLNGTMHAREWLSPMTTTYMAEHLVADYPDDERVKNILDKTRVIIVPILNIDGFEYTWSDDRYWRKNRRDGVGVDLNRNWGAYWAASSDTSSETYPGTSGFSEPETAAWRDFASALPKVAAFVDWHTPFETVMCPFFGSDDPPHHASEHTSWAKEMAQAINQKHGEMYGDCGGLRANRAKGGGISIDWFVGDEAGGLGSMGWLVEMRGPDFVVDPSEIVPTAEENYEAFLTVMSNVADAFGDDSDDEETSDESSSSAESSQDESDSSDGESSEDHDEDSSESEESATESASSGEQTSADDDAQDEDDESGDVTSQDSAADNDDEQEADDAATSTGGCQMAKDSRSVFDLAWLAGAMWGVLGQRRRRNTCSLNPRRKK
jgi:predicted deacylase